MEPSTRRSILHQVMISQFIDWSKQNQLTLNPHFQRRAVWTNDAKTYLIDSILQGFPIPEVYLRTKIDVRTKVAFRDVVDGQQRLRTILDFSNDKLVLNRRSEHFQGKRYSDLPEELQESFLGYHIGVEQLLNANDSYVLQVFARLNSYTVPLNPAEKRHALYETELKWFIHDIADEMRWFIERYELISTARLVRMEDDAFFAELVNVLVNGIDDGGAKALDSMYRRNLREERGIFIRSSEFKRIIENTIEWSHINLEELLQGPTLSKPYQFFTFFAAYVHQTSGLPSGRLKVMPPKTGLDSVDMIRDRLSALSQAAASDDLNSPFRDFVEASSGATTRFAGRSERFLAYNNAIAKG